MLAEAEAEDKGKNPTRTLTKHFSRARGGRRPQVEQRGTRRFTRYGNPQRVTGSSAFCVAGLTTLFQNLVPTKRRLKAGGGALDCKRMGEVTISYPDGSEGWLRDALLVPNLGVSLVSLSKLCEHGLEGSFNKTVCTIAGE
ncbi:hypothetical protein E4U51_003203 [Claviceps purpurea]|nr:hypothetical protein E4U51_003203 [Claviceps purpurea]